MAISLGDLMYRDRYTLHAERQAPGWPTDTHVVAGFEFAEITRKAINLSVRAMERRAFHALIRDPALNADKITG